MSIPRAWAGRLVRPASRLTSWIVAAAVGLAVLSAETPRAVAQSRGIGIGIGVGTGLSILKGLESGATSRSRSRSRQSEEVTTHRTSRHAARPHDDDDDEGAKKKSAAAEDVDNEPSTIAQPAAMGEDGS